MDISISHFLLPVHVKLKCPKMNDVHYYSRVSYPRAQDNIIVAHFVSLVLLYISKHFVRFHHVPWYILYTTKRLEETSRNVRSHIYPHYRVVGVWHRTGLGCSVYVVFSCFRVHISFQQCCPVFEEMGTALKGDTWRVTKKRSKVAGGICRIT